MLPSPKRGGALLGALLCGALLAGCVPTGEGPVASPSASPTATPVFATEEEALAAAEEAYASFLATGDLIASEGGVDANRIEPFVTDDQLSSELEGFSLLESQGIVQRGQAVLRSAELQGADLISVPATLAAYVCVDYSGVVLLRADETVVETLREFDTVLVLARFEWSDSRGRFLVSAIEPWQQDSAC